MNPDRRQFLATATITAVGAAALARLASARPLAPNANAPRAPLPPGEPGRDYRPVTTLDGATLPFKVVDDVKVFHLIAEEVDHEFAPGLVGHCWGYNGRVHGPTIEAVEGDRVRIYVTNRLPTTTTVHWHGVKVPSGMDGVGGLSQRAIAPGETFKYEFTIEQHGTFLYHSHHDEMTQMAMGMMGLIVVHPRAPSEPPPDRDFAFLLSEWKITPGTMRPDPNEMVDFNVLTLNARIFPATSPIVAKAGDRVRIRFGNLSAMDHHPMHLHGHSFDVVATDGGEIPVAGRWPETSVLVPVGSTRTVEFVARPGDWPLHCHMTHHVMTQMGHGIPNLIGVDPSRFDEAIGAAVPSYLSTDASADRAMDSMNDVPRNSLPMMGGAGPFGYITMGGMFTIVKVRDAVDDSTAAGWYAAPPGTQADLASADELRRDGIDPGAKTARDAAPAHPEPEHHHHGG